MRIGDLKIIINYINNRNGPVMVVVVVVVITGCMKQTESK